MKSKVVKKWALWIIGFWVSLLGLGLIASQAEESPSASAPVPVLCYHRFGQYPPQDPYFVTQDEFRRQLSIIKEEGYTPILVSEWEAGLAGRQALPAKPLLITLDDGYRDVLTNALPILKEFGYTATLFVYPVFVGSKNGLTVEQLKTLRAEGWEIGSHSYTHPKLTKYEPNETSAKYAKRLAWELADSRKKLQGWLDAPVDHLAYPYGLWNQTVADAARAAGYTMMFTVDQGTNAADTPRDQFKRIMICHNTSDKTFRFLLRDHPLRVSERSPEAGRVLSEAISRVVVTLAPELRTEIDPKTFKALLGSQCLETTYAPESGQLTLSILKPWTRGTNVITLTAQDGKHQRHFKECWLVSVEPAPTEGGSIRVESKR